MLSVLTDRRTKFQAMHIETTNISPERVVMLNSKKSPRFGLNSLDKNLGSMTPSYDNDPGTHNNSPASEERITREMSTSMNRTRPLPTLGIVNEEPTIQEKTNDIRMI